VNIAFFGSSLVSAYWNGAATYYRGILRALAERGHHVTFFEPDAYDRQAHRDIDDPPWATVVVYPPTLEAVGQMIDRACAADLVVKASGVGVHDELLEHAVAELRGPRRLVAFWDVDAPATLDRCAQHPADPFLPLVPRFDLVLTYGGGQPVIDGYARLGARRAVPIYNALDPTTHHPVPPDPRFAGALAFLGNRLPDRERRAGDFFFGAAARLGDQRCLLGGAGWGTRPMPPNVHYLGHVGTGDHNAFNASPLCVLNISRDSMAAYGFSPATRVFEAVGAGACLITDAWRGIEQFFEPGSEILVARDGEEVAAHVLALRPADARAIGACARKRALAEHTYAHRAADVEAALGEDARRTVPGTLRAAARTAAARARPMSIVVLGLSITSSWGNGHATTYRGLLRELAARGHRVTFLERDVPWYARHRDLPAPPYARTEFYTSVAELEARFAHDVRDADLVIVGSYVPDGIEIGRWVIETARGVTAFYDLDTPVTLARLAANDCPYLARELVPRYGLYLSFTGGPTLQRLERELGARRARALYCAVDPREYRPEPRPVRWDLGYMGTYSRDRQPAVERLLVEPARQEPARRFVVAGPEYPADLRWPGNVERREHLAPDAHRAFYNELHFALNVTRAPMLAAGWSPSVRLFEAAACATPIISDPWEGLGELLEPGREILIADTTEDVLRHLRDTTDAQRHALGARACIRVRAAHTAAHRAADLERYAKEP